MSEFCYVPPDSGAYLAAVLQMLQGEHREPLHEALENAECSFFVTGDFSHVRWNGVSTVVTFRVPITLFKAAELDEQEEKYLRGICQRVMPPDLGLDVTRVDVVPALASADPSLGETIKGIADRLHVSVAKFPLPPDVLAKARDMADAYLYLFAVENYLRVFIGRVAEEANCTLAMPKQVADSILKRKTEESKNAWMSVRGDSELYYVDFKDLGAIISNNWGLFKDLFPDQAWIVSKIDELGKCRNLVAHNSYLSDHDREVVRVDFESIVRQLNSQIGRPSQE